MPVAHVADEVTIAYDDWDFSDPWAESESVILVHGMSKKRSSWYRWIPPLSGEYRTIVPETRGRGESSPLPAGFEMSLEPFADDIVGLLDTLGLKSAHIVCADFATCVGIDLAARYPDRVRSLSLAGLVANLARDMKTVLPSFLDMLKSEGVEGWARQTVEMRLPSGDPAMQEWYIREQADFSVDFLEKIFGFVSTLDLTNRLAEVTVPTLVLAGSAAKQYPVERTLEAAQLLPNARVVVIEGAPYNVNVGAPERASREVLQFLREIDAGPS